MSSVQFDGTEILTTTYIPRFVQHEDAPDRNLLEVSIARSDGNILIAEWYGSKVIRLQGKLVGSSQADLESKIDAFKELFSRPEKNLDISWNGGTRRYVATCSKHQFMRDHYNIDTVPWTAEFTVSTGLGYDTGTTTPINASSITTADPGDGTFVYTGSFTMSGSKPAAPTITLVFGPSVDSTMLGIEFMNTDTGERILITRNASWSNGTVIIDCDNKQVRDNIASGGTPVEGNFFGLFPTFKIGTNNFKITTGGIVNQTSSETSIASGAPNVSFYPLNNRLGQGLTVPYADATFGALILGLSRQYVSGAVDGSVFALLKPDDGTGKPDIGASSLASWTITAASISAYPTFSYLVAWASGAFSLSPDTPYWLVIGSASGTANNHSLLALPVGDTYPRGTSLTSTDAGTTWSADGQIPAFRLLVGGQSKATDITLTVAYTKTYL